MRDTVAGIYQSLAGKPREFPTDNWGLPAERGDRNDELLQQCVVELLVNLRYSTSQFVD